MNMGGWVADLLQLAKARWWKASRRFTGQAHRLSAAATSLAISTHLQSKRRSNQVCHRCVVSLAIAPHSYSHHTTLDLPAPML